VTVPTTPSASLWCYLLPVIQDINNYGGNFISAFLCRSVIEEIDKGANDGDMTLREKRDRIRDAIRRGQWPHDPSAFNAIFETYHEALFYLLARLRGVALRSIAEGKTPTPDFATVAEPEENFEVKTIDFSGGNLAYTPLSEEAPMATCS
jgi:hypothetical protein